MRLEKGGIKSIYKVADLNAEDVEDVESKEEEKNMEIITKPV